MKLGRVMLTICDTHILLFWADQPHRLTVAAQDALDVGLKSGELACSDISLWEISMLYAKGRLDQQAGMTSADYTQTILTAMEMAVLPITPEIAELSQSHLFNHGDPADRLIAATALINHAPLITADEKLRATKGLRCIW